MDDVTAGLLGGVLVGLGASLLLAWSGRVAGVSGMIGGIVAPRGGDLASRAWFLAGLVFAGVVALAFAPGQVASSPRPIGWLVLAGLLVGIGTRLAGGCTSGHGVCGVSRLAPRSWLATALFVATGIATATLIHVWGLA